MHEFPKKQRLLLRSEFTKTMNDGIKIVTPHLVLIAKEKQNGDSRIGFIVSKKVGNAVVRNCAKRRLREIFRTQVAKPESLDIVVIARYKAVEAEFQEVARSFQGALLRLQSRLQRAQTVG